MAWYRSELETPQKAKTAVVNAVGISAFYAVYFIGFSPQSKRHWISVLIGAAFAGIAWGIRRMSRAAAIAGLLLCMRWVLLLLPHLVLAIFRYSNGMAMVWLVANFVFLSFYIIALRATFAYHHLKKSKSSISPAEPDRERVEREAVKW
jgi:hypothetical protein